MGFYSSFEFNIVENVVIDKAKAAELEKYFSNFDNEDVMGFFNVKLVYDKKNRLKSISTKDTYSKFYDDELFAAKLADVILKGAIDLHFVGEDGGYWGYRVRPKQQVEGLNSIPMTNKEYEKWQRFKGILNVIDALMECNDDTPIVKKGGSGFQDMRFPKGTTAREIKLFLQYFLRDLAVDLIIENRGNINLFTKET